MPETLSPVPALAARRRLSLAIAVFALSIEAMKAPLDPYDAVFEDPWEDPGEVAALRLLPSGGSGANQMVWDRSSLPLTSCQAHAIAASH